MQSISINFDQPQTVGILKLPESTALTTQSPIVKSACTLAGKLAQQTPNTAFIVWISNTPVVNLDTGLPIHQILPEPSGRDSLCITTTHTGNTINHSLTLETVMDCLKTKLENISPKKHSEIYIIGDDSLIGQGVNSIRN